MSSLPITLQQLLASPISPYSSRPRDEDVGCDEMMLGIPGNAALPPVLQNHHPEQLQQQLLLCESSGEEQEPRQPKKRAETWVQEETRILISLRREIDARFNTTKSNKHLWDKISAKMRDMGFDRSSNMCIDKWRNLLKEFKKAKNGGSSGSGTKAAKVSCYREIEEILKERSKNAPQKSSATPKSDSFVQFSDNGLEDAVIAYGSAEASGGSALSQEGQLNHEGHALTMAPCGTVAAIEDDPWNWRDNSTDGTGAFVAASANSWLLDSGASTHMTDKLLQVHTRRIKSKTLIDPATNSSLSTADPTHQQQLDSPNDLDMPITLCKGGDDHAPYGGKVIIVKLGEYARKIGIDGSPEAVKGTIRAVFGIRTRRPFWLEDEDQVVHTLDRNMPLGIYTLHFDQGITIKICLYDDTEQIPIHTEDKTIYTQADFCEFLTRRNWVGLRELNGFGSVDTMDDLCPGGMYRGVRLLTN